MEYTRLVHTYEDEATALDAVDNINAGEGIPVEGGETETYTVVLYDEAREFWYLIADAVTEQYCGEPEEVIFTIETEI